MTRKAWIIVGGVIAAAAIAVAVTIIVTHNATHDGLAYEHGEMMRGFGSADRGFGGGYDWSRAVPWFLLAALVGVGAALAVWQPWRARPAAAVAGASGAVPFGTRVQFDEWHRAAHGQAGTSPAEVADEPSEWTTSQMAAAGHPAAPPVQPMGPPELPAAVPKPGESA